MDRKDRQEHLSTPPTLTCELLLDALGYNEPSELTDLRLDAVGVYDRENDEFTIALVGEYQRLAYDAIPPRGSADETELQRMAVGLSAARIWRDCNDTERYQIHLQDCLRQAEGIGPAMITIIEQLIEESNASIDPAYNNDDSR